MRKPAHLRDWLCRSIPALAGRPDLIQIYVEAGRIVSRQSRTLSYEYRYVLKILVCDFAGSTDTLIVPMLAWIETEQPELLRKADGEPFVFEAEILDGDRADVEISIELTEPVLVIPREDGSGYDVDHPAAPSFADEFAGVGASWLRECYAGDDLVGASDTVP